MAVQAKPMTVEEFWAQYAGRPYELVRGKIVEVAPTGFRLALDTLRAPDCAYIDTEKMASLTEAERYAPFAPDLAVEVVSPGDTASDTRDKVNLYRAAGTGLVWVIYPSLRKVDVYLPDGTAREVGAQEMLDGGDVLPGLQIAVKEVFPAE